MLGKLEPYFFFGGQSSLVLNLDSTKNWGKPKNETDPASSVE